jgi:hypothetical protein
MVIVLFVLSSHVICADSLRPGHHARAYPGWSFMNLDLSTARGSHSDRTCVPDSRPRVFSGLMLITAWRYPSMFHSTSCNSLLAKNFNIVDSVRNQQKPAYLRTPEAIVSTSLAVDCRMQSESIRECNRTREYMPFNTNCFQLCAKIHS